MLISKLKGGLGNQLFIYSFVYSLSRRYLSDFCFDLDEYKFKIGRKLELDKFSFDLKECNKNDLKKFKKISRFTFEEKIKLKFKINLFNKKIIKEDNFNIRKLDNVYNKNKNYYIDGYWQNIKFFLDNRNVLNNKFKITNNHLSEKYFKLQNKIIKNNDIVCLHIRKGDYLKNQNLLIYKKINMEYYKNALEILRKDSPNINIYIFSDDYEWVSKNFECKNSIMMNTYKLNTIEEFTLMSQFNKIIITNSTYSLWASILNNFNSKLIICPKYWFKKENSLKTSKLFTKNMLILEN